MLRRINSKIFHTSAVNWKIQDKRFYNPNFIFLSIWKSYDTNGSQRASQFWLTDWNPVVQPSWMQLHGLIQWFQHRVASSFRLPACRDWLSLRSHDPAVPLKPMRKNQCTNFFIFKRLIKSTERILTSHCALLDKHLLTGAFSGRGVESRVSHRGAGEPVSRHVFAVCFPDNPKGARVGVRNVGDRVPVQRRLMGDGTYLLDRQLGAGLGLGWERRLKGLVIAKRDVSAGAEAPGRLLWGRGGVGRRRLRDVLVQPSSRKNCKKCTLRRRKAGCRFRLGDAILTLPHPRSLPSRWSERPAAWAPSGSG